MNGWAALALAVIALPILLVARWIVTDWRKARRRARFLARQKPDYSALAIVARVEQERADESVAWPTADADTTDVLPAGSPDDEPTEVFPRPTPRKRRYIDSPVPMQRPYKNNT